MPGLDAINHEGSFSQHPDLTYNQIFFVKGKAEVRASRTFKVGEEFLINYDAFESVVTFFKDTGYL